MRPRSMTNSLGEWMMFAKLMYWPCAIWSARPMRIVGVSSMMCFRACGELSLTPCLFFKLLKKLLRHNRPSGSKFPAHYGSPKVIRASSSPWIDQRRPEPLKVAHIASRSCRAESRPELGGMDRLAAQLLDLAAESHTAETSGDARSQR